MPSSESPNQCTTSSAAAVHRCPVAAATAKATAAAQRERGQMVGPHEGGQPARDRLEEPLLGPREEERLLAWGVGAAVR